MNLKFYPVFQFMKLCGIISIAVGMSINQLSAMANPNILKKDPQSPNLEADLNGTWIGSFTMDKKVEEHFGFIFKSSRDVVDSTKMSFQVRFTAKNGKIEGVSTESNPGEDRNKVPIHRAQISGTVKSDVVEFTKTYENQPWIIEYKGALSSDRKSITGKYSSKDLTGPFEMEKLIAKP